LNVNDDDDDDDGKQELQGEKQRRQDETEEINGIQSSWGSDRSHNTSDEKDKDLRPTKRRKLPSTSTDEPHYTST
jgi:hypothetical protein